LKKKTGEVSLTPAASNNLKHNIALVYPFGPNSNVQGYNATLLTMTPNAQNAFLQALTNTWSSVLPNLHTRRLGYFVDRMITTNTLHRVPSPIVQNLNATTKSSIQYYRDKKPSNVAIEETYQELMDVETELKSRILGKLEKYGNVSLSSPVYLDSSSDITAYTVDDTGTVKFTTKDRYTGDQDYVLELDVHTLYQVSANV
jgi:hypothetical protein